MTTEPKQPGAFATLKKRSAAVAILCFSLLLLTQCSTPRHSSYSARPDYIPPGITIKSVRIEGLDGDFFHGTTTRPQKAVILLGGSEGGRMWSYAPAFIQELVDQGFCVMSLAYFGTDDLPTDLRGIPLGYFSKAFRWLSTQPEVVVPDDYALVGVSRGAELALLLASRHSEVKATIAIAPSSVVFPGPPTGKLDALSGQHSAWSENGNELSFVPIPYSGTTLRGMIPGKRTRMFEKALQNSQRVKEAAIPVEKIQGPILLISFTRDEIWPSTLMSEQIIQRLRGRQFRFHYEHATYDAGHSAWSIEPCRTKMLTFLKERFLRPAPELSDQSKLEGRTNGSSQ